MKKYLLFPICICCILLFQACPLVDRDPEFLYLENNSNDTLATYVADGSYTAYPDTLLPNNYKSGLLSGTPEGRMTGAIYYFRVWPEDFFKKLPKDTLSIFILDMNNHNIITMDSMWKEMNYGKRFLLRYDLSLTDLQILNFTIPYPPSKTMKGMKMYPAYEE